MLVRRAFLDRLGRLSWRPLSFVAVKQIVLVAGLGGFPLKFAPNSVTTNCLQRTGPSAGIELRPSCQACCAKGDLALDNLISETFSRTSGPDPIAEKVKAIPNFTTASPNSRCFASRRNAEKSPSPLAAYRPQSR
jgi:hypothetical protein